MREWVSHACGRVLAPHALAEGRTRLPFRPPAPPWKVAGGSSRGWRNPGRMTARGLSRGHSILVRSRPCASRRIVCPLPAEIARPLDTAGSFGSGRRGNPAPKSVMPHLTLGSTNLGFAVWISAGDPSLGSKERRFVCCPNCHRRRPWWLVSTADEHCPAQQEQRRTRPATFEKGRVFIPAPAGRR